MKKLWVGYLLMMLSTNIILCISPFENSQLVLFPPFIGYIVMAAAYHKLKKKIRSLAGMRQESRQWRS